MKTKPYIMKRIYSLVIMLFAIAAITGMSSCSKDPVRISYNVGDITVNLPVNGTERSESAAIVITQQQIRDAFSAAGQTFNPNKIVSGKLKKMTCAMTATGVKLTEISGIEVYVRNVGSTADGEQIAYAQSVDKNATELELTMNGTELREWLLKDSFEVFVKIWTKGTTTAQSIKATKGVIEIELDK